MTAMMVFHNQLEAVVHEEIGEMRSGMGMGIEWKWDGQDSPITTQALGPHVEAKKIAMKAIWALTAGMLKRLYVRRPFSLSIAT